MSKNERRPRDEDNANKGDADGDDVEEAAVLVEKDLGEDGDEDGNGEDDDGGVGEGHVPEGVEGEHQAGGADEAAQDEHEAATLGKGMLALVDEDGYGREENADEAKGREFHGVDVDQGLDDDAAEGEEEGRYGGQDQAQVRAVDASQFPSALGWVFRVCGYQLLQFYVFRHF